MVVDENNPLSEVLLNVEKAALVMPKSSRPPPNGEVGVHDVLPPFGSSMSGGASSGNDGSGVDDEEEDAEDAAEVEVERRPKVPEVPTPFSKGDFGRRSRLLAPPPPSAGDGSTNSWTDLGVSACLGVDVEKARDSIACICAFWCCCWVGGRNWRLLADWAVPPCT